MKIIAVGTGPSLQKNINFLKNIDRDEFKIFAFHDAYRQLVLENIEIDYWTWRDPYSVAAVGTNWTPPASVDLIKTMINDHNFKFPKVILPNWAIEGNDEPSPLHNTQPKNMYQYRGGSPMWVQKTDLWDKYNWLIDELKKANKLEPIKNATSSKFLKNTISDKNLYESLILNPSHRFNYHELIFQTYVHINDSTAPWSQECAMTGHVFPISAQILNAEKVYCLGVDGRSGRFARPFSSTSGAYKLWNSTEWYEHHNMKIYSLMADNEKNTILPYVNLEELL